MRRCSPVPGTSARAGKRWKASYRRNARIADSRKTRMFEFVNVYPVEQGIRVSLRTAGQTEILIRGRDGGSDAHVTRLILSDDLCWMLWLP